MKAEVITKIRKFLGEAHDTRGYSYEELDELVADAIDILVYILKQVE